MYSYTAMFLQREISLISLCWLPLIMKPFQKDGNSLKICSAHVEDYSLEKFALLM